MTEAPSPEEIREAVGVLDHVDELESAIDELLEAGFDRSDISLLAGQKAVEEKLGHLYSKVSDLEDDAEVPREAYVSKESMGAAEGALFGSLAYVGAVGAAGVVVASGGALAVVIAAAAAAGGVGGLIGTVLASWLDLHHANYLSEQLDRGGLLLWVRTWNKDQEKRAQEILQKYSAHDVHVHSRKAKAPQVED